MIVKDAIDILKSIQDSLEETRFLERCAIDMAIEALKAQKHGEWIISEVRCPYCLEYFDTDGYTEEELNRCPNCGASMRKEGDAE